jgi:hypothetical protein
LIDPKDKDLMAPAGTDKMITSGEDSMEDDKTAFDSAKKYFLANPKLPITLMGIGVGLVVALLLLSLLKRRKEDDEPPITPTGGMGVPNKYEDSLQSKINTLKNESMKQPNPGSVPPTISTPPTMTTPPAMTPPPTSGLDSMKIPQNNPVRNESGEVFSSESKSSSMLDKLKNKNITPPSV